MKKTLIALAAAATFAVGFSATAKADSFGFGFGGYGQPHFGISVNDGYGYGGDYGYRHGGDYGYRHAGYGDDEGDGRGYGWHRHPRCHTEWVGGRWDYPHRVLVCRR